MLIKLSVLLLMTVVSAQQTCSDHGFSLKLENECSIAKLRAAFEEYISAPENQFFASSNCNADSLDILLNGQDVDDLCHQAIEADGVIDFDEIFQQEDRKFVESFYRGYTYWNEEVQTNYDLDDPNGPTTNVLRKDIAQVPHYYELAEQKMIRYPEEHDNFSLENCSLNAVMCCWPLDRQANDNNGNCATPYDTNCIDKDPADNTDVCGIGLDRGNTSNNLNTNGFTVFDGDNDDGEGPAHCHGFAYSNNKLDPESRYKGNNLFYISMYDHKYKRGYARNFPGSPMCGCVEQMPVVTRSDCTQVDVTENFSFHYDPSSGFKVTVSDVNIEFNACQGLKRNNDLSSYVARLESEGKITLSQKNGLKKHLVENGNCPNAIQRMYASKGFVKGFPDNAFEQVYSFPTTDTDQLVHGFCVLGAANAAAFSDTFPGLDYTVVSDFKDGVRLWGDRDYVASGVSGEAMCENGLYLQPNKHKTIPRFSDIIFGANPRTSGNEVVMCAFIVTDGRDGQWDQELPGDRFAVSSTTFRFTNGRIRGNMRSYCKVLPEPPTPAPSPAPTGPESEIYFSFPPTRTKQFVHGLCVMGASFVEATSTNVGLKYTMASQQFDNGVGLWNDRDYVADGVRGIEMCQGGIYLKPTKHKAIARGTKISVEALSDTRGEVTLCAFIASDGRDGQWDVDLAADGFTVSSATFRFTNGRVTGNMRSYCKEI